MEEQDDTYSGRVQCLPKEFLDRGERDLVDTVRNDKTGAFVPLLLVNDIYDPMIIYFSALSIYSTINFNGS